MKRPPLWPGMVFGLIGLNVAVVSLTLYLAHSDASFAVEPDYYQKAVAWDASVRARAASDGLGWSAALEVSSSGAGQPPVLTLRLIDRAGRPISDAQAGVEAFASARAADRRLVAMRPAEPGVYVAPFPNAQPGQWEFRISVSRGADRFEKTVERRIDSDPEDHP